MASITNLRYSSISQMPMEPHGLIPAVGLLRYLVDCHSLPTGEIPSGIAIMRMGHGYRSPEIHHGHVRWRVGLCNASLDRKQQSAGKWWEQNQLYRYCY